MVFVIATIFVVGKTINPEQKYVSAYDISTSKIK